MPQQGGVGPSIPQIFRTTIYSKMASPMVTKFYMATRVGSSVFLWVQQHTHLKVMGPSIPPPKKKNWDPLHSPKQFDLEPHNLV